MFVTIFNNIAVCMADWAFQSGSDLYRRCECVLRVQPIHDPVNENLEIRIGEAIYCSQYAFDVVHSHVLLLT